MFKKRFPLLLTFIAGTLPILSFFFTAPALLENDPSGNGVKHLSDTFEQWMLILAAGALLLGVVNVFQVNLKKISNRSQGWPYAVVFLSALIITAVFGLWDAFSRATNTVWYAHAAYLWIVEAGFKPLQATMFSLLAFYVASAAFRAFRVRNVEAAILLAAALLIMLGVNPYIVRLLPFLPDLTQWTLNIPNAAAQRGIIIGAALGAASMALRILIGIERSYLGLQKGE
jgi:hypothetical protein